MTMDHVAPYVRDSFEAQIAHCQKLNAPITAAVVAAILAGVEGPGEFRARIRRWGTSCQDDALSLRAAAGLRALYLSGAVPELAYIYDDAVDAALINRVIDAHDTALLPWLDGPPQTNEAGRSANYIAALLWLQRAGLPPRWDCIEIGSSAGINLMLDRYGFDLGGVRVGPADAAMEIVPEWRGAALAITPDADFAFASVRGCDVAPIDLTDADAVFRLRCYIWPEHHERFARLDRAAACARAAPPDLIAADAAEFVEQALAEPQAAGTTRVLMHSVVWQYLGAERQARITAAMARAGAAATKDRPLAWVSAELNLSKWRHEVRVRHWPGGGDSQLLALPHPHGQWINWLG